MADSDKTARLPLDQLLDTDRQEHFRKQKNRKDAAAGVVEGVGERLCAARSQRGEDIAAVAEVLRIRSLYLKALEENDYNALPGRSYAIGFVGTYATYLGLPRQELVEAYKAEMADPESEGAKEIVFPEMQDDPRLSKGLLVIALFILGMVMYGGWYFSLSAEQMLTNRESGTQSVAGESLSDRFSSMPLVQALPLLSDTPETPEAPSSPEAPSNPEVSEAPGDQDTQKPVSASTVVAVPGGSPAEAATEERPEKTAIETGTSSDLTENAVLKTGRVLGADGGRVSVRALRKAWMRVEDANGNVLISQTLNKGDSYRAPDLAGLILVARDAGAFEIFLDNRLLGYAGPSGLVLTGKSLNPSDL